MEPITDNRPGASPMVGHFASSVINERHPVNTRTIAIIALALVVILVLFLFVL